MILALVGNGQNNNKDDPLVVLKQLELTERSNERARQDQQMMLQLMQQQSDRNMQLMFELMRGNGNRSSIEEQILTKAVNNMLDPEPERGSSTLWQDISESGVLEKVSQGIGTVMSNMRPVPAGSNPYANNTPTPQENMLNYAEMPSARAESLVRQPSMPQQVPAPVQAAPQVTFDQKALAVYDRCQELGLDNPQTVGIQATPEQWGAILTNAINTAVQRGEYNYPGDIDAQLSQAIGELNIVLNARRLAGLLQQIKNGTFGVEQVSSMAAGNPLFEMVQSIGAEGILAVMQEYAAIDAPNIKIIGWDIEQLLSMDNRPIIQQVLSAGNQGA